MSHKCKLFFIPYAGGSSTIFQSTQEALPDSIECILLDYAGHGSRMKEGFYPDNQAMFEDIAGLINANLEPEDVFGIFGYSIGSVVTYEILAQKLLVAEPKYVFVASHEGPEIRWKSKAYNSYSDEKLLETLRRYGGFDRVREDMLKNRVFYKLFFMPLREDYRLIAEYQMSQKTKFPVPATVFYGNQDLTAEEIRTWEDFLIEGSEFVAFPGQHFFIRDYGKEVADIIGKKLEN